MRVPRAPISAAIAVAVVAALAGLPGTASASVQAAAITTGVTADYEMNEPAGSTVMTDSSGNGLNGSIDPTGLQTGVVFDGATGYNWIHRAPEAPPPSPERIIQVPDNIALEPGDQQFTIEIRYRTKENFGNIIQKGQATSRGGQWKIQAPGGIPSCLFKGSAGEVATGAITPLNDNAWHTLTCVLSSTSVSMYVDGVFRHRKNGTAGTIDNSIPMTVAGKINCDQIDTTCDYFSGQIDYVKISKGVNQPPTARIASSCNGLACTFDGSGSTDADGSIASYAWTFGDGSTSTEASPHHAYAAPGTYSVRLTVTDSVGTSASTTSSVDVGAVGNQDPIADFSSSCTFLDCAFDSSASSDTDGTIASRAWSFDDGDTSTAANPSHSFAASGSYDVSLTVTDNQGATGSVTKTVTVTADAGDSPVAFVGARTAAANNNNPTVTVPATAAGQRLVMFLSMNNLARTVSDPTGVTGWTRLDNVAAKTMSTTAWTKVAQSGDVGTAVHVPLSGVAKYTLSLAAYSGADASAPVSFARSIDVTAADTVRATPDVTTSAGSWVVSYWADKSSTTTAWTPGASVTTRSAGCAADAGRICSTLADSAAAVPAGTYGHISASTDAPSDMATMWSVVLAPAAQGPGNVLPTADFSSSCTFLSCDFNSSDSSDSDGTIASRAWSFDDGATSTDTNPSHTFAAGGSYDVVLTVTDNQGGTDSMLTTVTVTADTGDSPIAFVGASSAAGNSNSPTVTVPATAVGQRLVLALSMNNLARTVSDPAGWSRLDSLAAKTMSTTVWTKVAQASDIGAAVRVPLSGVAKNTLSVAAYSGVDTSAPVVFARSADLTNDDTARATPDVTATTGSWVVSYWADKSSTTTAWSPAGSVTTRGAVCGADAGRICSALADSAAAVPAGTYGHVTASTDAPSDMATMWSVVLAPAP
jgi:PKD repeat protein